MLSLRLPAQLADALRVQPVQLYRTLNTADRYFRRHWVASPVNAGKPRLVVSALSPLYNLQLALLRNVLKPNFRPSPRSFGGVRGGSIRKNALEHAGQQFVYTTDVSDFFRSIRAGRVRAWFREVGCSEQVAAMCARLCTFDDRLEQGLMTSPFLADQLMIPVDDQIGRACRKRGLVYTRYVDDISVSGPFDFGRSRIPHLIRRILKFNGFRANEEKEQCGALEDGTPITKLRLRNGHLDVRKEYADELLRMLNDHISLSMGGKFTGPYLTHDRLWGKVSFVCWVNPGRSRQLYSLLGRIDPRRAYSEAQRLGLVGLLAAA
jgi:hypothetical protein